MISALFVIFVDIAAFAFDIVVFMHPLVRPATGSDRVT